MEQDRYCYVFLVRPNPIMSDDSHQRPWQLDACHSCQFAGVLDSETIETAVGLWDDDKEIEKERYALSAIAIRADLNMNEGMIGPLALKTTVPMERQDIEDYINAVDLNEGREAVKKLFRDMMVEGVKPRPRYLVAGLSM